MPTYRIKTPEGTFKVSSDKDLTDEEVYAYVTQQAKAAPAQEAAPKAPATQQELAAQYGASGFDATSQPQKNFKEFLGGAKHAWDKAAMGLKGLVTDLTPEDRALLEQGRAFTREGSWRTNAGNIAGDIAIGAGPVTKGAAALKAVGGMLPAAVARFAPLAADVAANTGWAAATAPENRGAAAMGGAVGAGLGHALPAAIGKLGQPVATSPITQTMLDEGISLTPGQAAKGWLPRALEGSLHNTPFMPGLRKSIGRAQARGQEEALDFLTDAGRMAANPKAHGLSTAEVNKWLKGAENINSAAGSQVPITSLMAMLHIKTTGASLAATSSLFGTETGRKFLLGQLPLQETLRRAPELAPYIAQLGRSAVTPDAPEAPTQE